MPRSQGDHFVTKSAGPLDTAAARSALARCQEALLRADLVLTAAEDGGLRRESYGHCIQTGLPDEAEVLGRQVVELGRLLRRLGGLGVERNSEPGAIVKAIRAALDEGRGFSLVRVGDGEEDFLALTAQDPERFPKTYESFDHHITEPAPLAAAMWEALEGADIIGIAGTCVAHCEDGAQHHPGHGFSLEEILAFNGSVAPRLLRLIEEKGKMTAGVGVNHALLNCRDLWGQVLSRRRVLAVGGSMRSWLGQLGRVAPDLLPHVELCRANTHPSSMEQLKLTLECIRSSDAEVVLASMGFFALPVCHFAQQEGKVGLDWGSVAHGINKQFLRAVGVEGM